MSLLRRTRATLARDVREIRKAEQILTAAGNVFLRDGYQ